MPAKKKTEDTSETTVKTPRKRTTKKAIESEVEIVTNNGSITAKEVIEAVEAVEAKEEAPVAVVVEEVATETVAEVTETVAEPTPSTEAAVVEEATTQEVIVEATPEEAAPVASMIMPAATWHTVGEYIAAFVPDAKPVTGAEVIAAFFVAEKAQKAIAASLAS